MFNGLWLEGEHYRFSSFVIEIHVGVQHCRAARLIASSDPS